MLALHADSDYQRRPRGSDMKRVLLFSASPFYGGGETYYVKLARLLRTNYEVSAVVANQQLSNELLALGVPTWLAEDKRGRPSPLRYPSIIAKVLHAVRDCHPHVIHLNGQSETYFASLLKVSRIPIVNTRHTAFDESVPAHKRLLFSQNLRGIERTVCVSSTLKAQLAKRVNERKLVVIPNWIDPLPAVKPYHPPKTGATLRLLYVGRIVHAKGIFDLASSLRRTRNVRLDVVGEGPELMMLKQHSGELPVRFHGFQSDCSPYYRNADLLVFPSHWEGCPQVPLEAMAHGVPTLASDIAANMELSDAGKTVELYKCGDVDDLAAKISALQANPDRLSELSKRGAKHIRLHYTKESAGSRYFTVLDEAIGPRRNEHR